MFFKDSLEYRALPLPDRFDWGDEERLAKSRNFYNWIRKRHSVRDFKKTKINKEIIENAIRSAGRAPSGANHQPWHFTAISNPDVKKQIRRAAEIEEEKFYSGGASNEWIKALEPIGTNANKPHLEIAPWLIIIFAERYGTFDDGSTYKNYYVPESVGIATGFLITALHLSGLSCLTHTPNPMGFLSKVCNRPSSNKASLILAVGYPANNAKIPLASTIKKSFDEVVSIF